MMDRTHGGSFNLNNLSKLNNLQLDMAYYPLN